MNDDELPKTVEDLYDFYKKQVVSQLGAGESAALDRLGSVVRDHMEHNLDAGITTEHEAIVATAVLSAFYSLINSQKVAPTLAYIGMMKWITDSRDAVQYDWPDEWT